MANSYILDKFVSTKPGQAYRLFPFGKITRGGVTRDITPEYAAQFKLPPFTPPIKLGSHEDATPAGGHIVRLEVRDDGLYGFPEYTEKGAKAMDEGDYRFHSPEVIWDDGALETSDGIIAGPLLLGDALLHTPYLGEATAFYTATTKEIDMQENISVPKSFLETLLGFLQPKREEPPTPEPTKPTPVTETAEFKAAVKEREDYKVQLETLKLEAATKETKAKLVAQLQKKEDYGMAYVELGAAEEAAGQLASMTDIQREWVMRNFKALTAQVDESKLTGEEGSERGAPIGENPRAEFNAHVEKIAKEKVIPYADALNIAKTTHADLFKAVFGGK
jgi:Mu-like prophage I protein